MTDDEFLQDVCRTMQVESPSQVKLLTLAMGLAGEAHEAAEPIKKWAEQGHPLNIPKITEELGDTLCYVFALAKAVGVDPTTLKGANVAKRKARYPDGFSAERSLNRSDT